MEWVNIKDRLPKPNVNILLYFRYDGRDYIETGWFNPGWKGLEAFGMTIGLEEYQHEISHWMPLPEPPAEGA